MTSSGSNLDRALSLLASGDLAAGFRLYEARMDHPEWVSWAERASFALNRHRLLRPGDAYSGRDILVVTEQGLGDNIMFARYLPLLGAQGARVTVACPHTLRPIFERIDGIHALLTPPFEQPMGKLNLSALQYDAFTPLLSLPYIFGTTLQTVPAGSAYLRIEPKRIAAWRERYADQGNAGRQRIGLVFQANPDGASGSRKSLRIGDVATLARVDGIDLVNLQTGPSGRELAALPGVIDAMSEALLLDEYAAAIAATDLLISVDTMAAHCAGAMGRPVWVILGDESGWNWGSGPTRSPWYSSAELFRAGRDGGLEGVVARLRQRLSPRPTETAMAQAAIVRGIRHHQREDLEPAIDSYRTALGHAPDSAQAWCNLALALGGLLRHDEALAAFEAAQTIAPDAPLVRLNKAQLLLLLGRWREGWEEYEWRWRLPRRRRTPIAATWDGSPVGTRTLLLFAELGLGDTIQMLRYLPLVAATVDSTGGGRLLLICQPPLRRLLMSLPGIELVGETDPLPRIDFELPLCSLPRLFATRPDTIPPQPTKLSGPDASDAAERVRATARPRIGIVWAGNPTMLNDATRSMPLAALAPLVRRAGASLFSLQKGEAEQQIEAADFGAWIIPLGPLLADMADTAAAIREMDLVISVCTSVAHLAGSLGKPTWLMLSYAADWRWLRERADTPWYPSMRIFRQTARGDWSDVAAQITQALDREDFGSRQGVR